MSFLKKFFEKAGKMMEYSIIKRRQKVMRALRADAFMSASALENAGAGSRDSIEVALEDLQSLGFVESRFRGGESTMRVGSVREYRRSRMGQQWLTSGRKI